MSTMPASVAGSGSMVDSHPSKSVTRMLQHAILQLCNEHIGYNHTLQVLGVLCMTVDDKQHELVVKVNNTLKRVNPVTPPKETLLYPTPSDGYQSPLLASNLTNQRQSPSMSNDESQLSAASSSVYYLNGGDISASAFGAVVEDTKVDKTEGSMISTRQGEEERMVGDCEGSAGGLRKHGRKQSNPIKVRNVSDKDEENSAIEKVNDDNDNGDEDETSVVNENNTKQMPGLVLSASHLRLKRGGEVGAKRKLDETLDNHAPAEIRSTGSATVRALLAGSRLAQQIRGMARNSSKDRSFKDDEMGSKVEGYGKDNDGDDDEDDGFRPLVIEQNESATDYSIKDRVQRVKSTLCSSTNQETALNFSLCALNGVSSNPPPPPPLKMNGIATVFASSSDSVSDKRKVKEETAAMSYYPNFDFLLNGFDGSSLGSSSSVGGFCSSFVGSSAATEALTLVNVLTNSGGISATDYDKLVGRSSVGSQNFSATKSLRDGPPPPKRKPRIRNRRKNAGAGIPGSSSMKVKDIIMFDDSAPLQLQRGSRIEGDFLLDSLNVDGKKRRRRTAEDTLTAEEIAEYMGSCSISAAAATQGSFRCRFCTDVAPDLSRYFLHTLSAHSAYICHQCGKNFTTKSSLLRHRPIHTGMRRFACSICRKAFYRKDKCKAHIKRHLGIGPDTPAASASVAGGVSDLLVASVSHSSTVVS